MKVWVLRVNIPAMSTIGYGWGETVDEEETRAVRFAGDHRPMMELGEAMEASGEEPVYAELEDWQILSITPLARPVH
jgi:hypothetical protein